MADESTRLNDRANDQALCAVAPRWRRLKPQPLHGLSTTCDSNGHVFVFGGSTTVDDSGIQSPAYRYDIATDTWSSIGPMPVGTRDKMAEISKPG